MSDEHSERALERARAKLANMPEPFKGGMLNCIERQTEPALSWGQEGRLVYLDIGTVRYYRDDDQHRLAIILKRGYVRWAALLPAVIAVMGLHDTWRDPKRSGATVLVLATLGLLGLLAAAGWWFWAFRPVKSGKIAPYSHGLYLFADDLVFWSAPDGKDHLKHIPRAQVRDFRAETGARNTAACLVIDYSNAQGEAKNLRCTIGMPEKLELKTLQTWQRTGVFGEAEGA